MISYTSYANAFGREFYTKTSHNYNSNSGISTTMIPEIWERWLSTDSSGKQIHNMAAHTPHSTG